MSHVHIASIIPAPKSAVFEWLTRVKNWTTLKKSSVELKLVSPDFPLQKGAEYEFELKRFGIPSIWAVKIEDFIPGEGFTEKQLIGIFQKFECKTELEDHGENQTKLTHIIKYETAFGIFGKLADDLILRKDLESLYTGFHDQLKLYFENPEA